MATPGDPLSVSLQALSMFEEDSTQDTPVGAGGGAGALRIFAPLPFV